MKVKKLLNEHVRYIPNDPYTGVDFDSELVAEQEATHSIDEKNVLEVIEETENTRSKNVGLSRQNAEEEDVEDVAGESLMQPFTRREK